ncbi:hypothetical protein [Mycobacterium xenopi]|uniref:PAS domain S-box/diguanylate cyclase (GGDEF) domain-containing protein n=2 Tax=Mycobacterium xenopi TaxID=1789 RepID=A0AAD1M403_MYCXE|nr:hypothetical protein [Mycobacterium xenopi]EUA43368.1 hypothetical protein I552_8109 [Mycobacterium xenopi 3993]EUA56400.1 hypothetical protein I553_8448 [Mycobacterium xenopi 4042]EID12597.1 hypothetical protein MXEN_12636 [Mycobacterium xenopi RIVM700367]MDA3641097.1 hypothetical protein [Mycobacterium xenopi]MDA3656551.1 hypothetical protein [Mycobacterium xenopi]
MARDNAEDLVDPSDFPEEGGPGQTLNPSESTDSDELRNADGDIVVDPPEAWSEADRIETTEGQERQSPSLDDRLAAEEPDVLDDTVDDDVRCRAHRGQVSGTPEDGDSLFEVPDE